LDVFAVERCFQFVERSFQFAPMLLPVPRPEMSEKLETGVQVNMAQMLFRFQFFLQLLEDVKVETSNAAHGTFGWGRGQWELNW